MAEISKGKRSTGRRSSILKRALADIDVNVKAEEKPSAPKSKRVSFAETCHIKEFPRDSPQVLKAAENDNSADPVADNSLQGGDIVPSTSTAPRTDTGQPTVDSQPPPCFILDDGETTFLEDVGNQGGFRESTRRFDRMDNYMFGEGGTLDISEIAQGDDSVFASSAPSTRKTAVTSDQKPSNGSSQISQVPLQPLERRAPLKQSSLKRTQELNFPHNEDKTVLFDDQDGGTMDLTLMDTFREGDFDFQQAPPAFSARNFLNMIRGPLEKRDDCTVLFSDAHADVNGMELTKNLTDHDLAEDFKFVPQDFNPVQEGDDFDIKDADSTTSVPKVSAKSFLMSLKANVKPVSSSSACDGTASRRSGVQGSFEKTGEAEQVEGNMTMELTCTGPLSKSIGQALLAPHALEPVAQAPQQVVTSVEDQEDDGTEMELTTCGDAVKPSVALAANSSAGMPANLSLNQTRNVLMDITAQYSEIVSPQPHVPVPSQAVFSCQLPLPSQDHTVHFSADADMEFTQNFVAGILGSSVQPPEEVTYQPSKEIVVFEQENTVANMSLTCSTLPPVVPEKRRLSNKTVMFEKEDTVGNMSLTCAISEHSQQMLNKSNPHKTVVFGEEMTANMSLTCTTLPSRPVVNKSLMSERERSGTDTEKNEKSILFKAEATSANMSLTCADPSELQQQNVNDQIATSSAEKQQSGNISVFTKDATTANMSLTCVDIPSLQNTEQKEERDDHPAGDFKADISQNKHTGPSNKSQYLQKSILFSKEATLANMSLTCTDRSLVDCTEHMKTASCGENHEKVVQNRKAVLTERQPLERSVLFSKEATSANMSFTCADLVTMEDPEQKAASYGENHENVVQNRKEVLFSKEATSANMSFTCADLVTMEDPEQKAASCGENHENVVQNRKEVLTERRPSEKSILFSKEATSANMSLTCADLVTMEDTEQKAAPCTDQTQTVTFRTSQGESQKQDEKSLHHSQMTGMNFMSPEAQIEGEMDTPVQQDLINPSCAALMTKSDQAQQKPALDQSSDGQERAQTKGVSAKSLDCFIQMKGDADQDDCVKREPTTLLEITSVLHSMKIQFEKGRSSEETGPESEAVTFQNKTTKNSSPTEQLASEKVNPTSSRDLQLSSSAATKKEADVSDLHSAMDTETAPVSNSVRLNSKTSDSTNVSLNMAKKRKREDSADSFSSISRSKGSTDSSLSSVRSQSSSSNCSIQSERFPDIFSETMPVFGTAGANASAASVSALSTSAITGSFLSLGRSCVEKQEKVEQTGSFLQMCEQLGIMQSDLKGWVCRRSSMAVRPEVFCETVEEQLNLASVTQPECESKVDFARCMDAMQQREEALSGELETAVMTQISQLGLVAEAERCTALRRQIRDLMLASRKEAQVLWKNNKADRLAALVSNMQAYDKTVSADVDDMSASIEQMDTVIAELDNTNSHLESRMEYLRTQMISRTSPKHHGKQQKLQQQQECAESRSLQEQLSEMNRQEDRLAQEERELRVEMSRSQERCQQSQQQFKDIAQAESTLSALQYLHCWRPVRVEDERVDMLLLYDAVWLSVRLSGSCSPSQPITSITATSQLAEGVEPWVLLCTQLLVDAVNTGADQLLPSCPSRQHLPQLLNQLTGLVEKVKLLGEEVRTSCLRHRVAIKGKQLTVTLWSTEHLRKVSLSSSISVKTYPESPLHWNVHVIMGDIGEDQVQAAVGKVRGGAGQWRRSLHAVLDLLQH